MAAGSRAYIALCGCWPMPRRMRWWRRWHGRAGCHRHCGRGRRSLETPCAGDEQPVRGTVRKKPVSLRLGFSGDLFGYSIELGYPPPSRSLFSLDPEIKRECIWHGSLYRRAAALVDRRRPVVTLPTDKSSEPEILTRNLNPFDSMLASIADPQRAPEMLEVREAIRGWRFYDSFRTDTASPVRSAHIGTFTPVMNKEGTD